MVLKADRNSISFLLFKLDNNHLGEGKNFGKYKKIDNLSDYYNAQKEKNRDFFNQNKEIINCIIDDFDMREKKFVSDRVEIKDIYDEAKLSMPLLMSQLADSGFDFNENEDISLRFINKSTNKTELNNVFARFQEWRINFSDNIKEEFVKQSGFLAQEDMRESLNRLENNRPPLTYKQSSSGQVLIDMYD